MTAIQDAAEVADIISSLQTEMENKEERADNQGHADWIRNIAAKTISDSGMAANSKNEIDCNLK